MNDFAQAVQDHEAWLRQARQLQSAAAVLVKEFLAVQKRRPQSKAERTLVVGCMRSALLLMAASIENSFKAVKMARGAVAISKGRIDKRMLGSHDLVKLAEEIGLDPTAIEARLIARLKPIAIWAGRYQHPLSDQEYQRALGDNPHTITLPTDMSSLDGILVKAEQLARGARGA